MPEQSRQCSKRGGGAGAVVGWGQESPTRAQCRSCRPKLSVCSRAACAVTRPGDPLLSPSGHLLSLTRPPFSFGLGPLTMWGPGPRPCVGTCVPRVGPPKMGEKCLLTSVVWTENTERSRSAHRVEWSPSWDRVAARTSGGRELWCSGMRRFPGPGHVRRA